MSDQKGKLEKIFKLHSEDLYRSIYLLCKEKGLAEQILHLTFIEAFKQIDQLLLNEETVKLNLFKLAFQISRDHVKINNLPAKKLVKDFHLNEGLLYADEFEGNIRGVLSKIDPEMMEIFLLYYYNQYSFMEIAKKLDINADIVKYRIENFDEMLRQQLIEYIQV